MLPVTLVVLYEVVLNAQTLFGPVIFVGLGICTLMLTASLSAGHEPLRVVTNLRLTNPAVISLICGT